MTRTQERVIAALLTSSTMKEAAAQVGISDVTLWRWLQDESFASAWRSARRQVMERAMSGLQAAADEAVATLKRNLTCGNPQAEIGAARTILEQGVKGIEFIDLQERVERLESLLDEQAKGKAKRWA